MRVDGAVRSLVRRELGGTGKAAFAQLREPIETF
jgi:hypothetical protein